MPHNNKPVSETRGATAYQMRSQGLSWAQIALALQTQSESAVTNIAKKYALRYGHTWPLKRRKAEEPEEPLAPARDLQREACELRQQGWTWARIQEGRYSAKPHAVAGARRYALREGLPWPISKP